MDIPKIVTDTAVENGNNYLFCIQSIIFQVVVMYYFGNR